MREGSPGRVASAAGSPDTSHYARLLPGTQTERSPLASNSPPMLRTRNLLAAVPRGIALATCGNNICSDGGSAIAPRFEMLSRARKLGRLSTRNFPSTAILGHISTTHWELAIEATTRLLHIRKKTQTRNGIAHRCSNLETGMKFLVASIGGRPGTQRHLSVGANCRA